MFSIIVSLAICGQVADYQTPEDYYMAFAVERFVYDAAKDPKGGLFRFDRIVPDRQARWLRMLNSNEYASRYEAVLLFEENIHDPMIRRAIMWGQFPEVKWPQIRHECELLTLKYYLCGKCYGRKICPGCDGTSFYIVNGNWIRCEECHYGNLCNKCRGSGVAVPNPSTFIELPEIDEIFDKE